MSDDVKHSEDDLELSGLGTGADDVSTDEDSEPLSIENDEEEQEDSQLSPAEKFAQEQAANLAAKIKAGKLTLDKLESSNQKWLVPTVKALLGDAVEGKKEAVVTEDVRAIAQSEVKQMLEAEKAKAAFQAMEATLKDAPLSKEQISLLKAEYNEIKKHSYDHKALEKAIKLAGIDLAVYQRRFDAMEAPRSGGHFPKVQSAEKAIVNQGKMSNEEVRAMLLKRKGL